MTIHDTSERERERERERGVFIRINS
jgi:hypothetical protein